MDNHTRIEFRNVTKRFPGTVALRQVNLAVTASSCHGLVGENGAGKSTLAKILGGICTPDAGEILVDGQPVCLSQPRDALAAGIGMVHQELAFCENLSVAENLCLGRLPARGPFLSRRRMRRLARERLAAIEANLCPDRLLGELSISQQQLVQIAAAVARGARILIFDEPTSSLSRAETEHLFALIRRLKSQGVTCLYVSHRLEEIFQLCSCVTVLRDGAVVATRAVSGLTEDVLVQMMIGRALEAYYPVHLNAARGEELLRVENLSRSGKFEGISFSLHKGEVLGLAGLVGSGRTDLAQAIFGLDPATRGSVFVRGHAVEISSPVQAMRLGIGLLPEDRKRHGLVLSMNARENVSLSILPSLSRLGWVRVARERELAQRFFDRLRVRAPSLDSPTAVLSGGNQQKLVLAKWLAAQCEVLLLDEPTRGVDVGAKAEIHGLIDQMANDGKAVLLISSDLPEIIALSTRILVLRQGRIVGEVARQDATQETLLRQMTGVKPS